MSNGPSPLTWITVACCALLLLAPYLVAERKFPGYPEIEAAAHADLLKAIRVTLNQLELLALDARIVLYGTDTSVADVPKPAIRPYPSKYAGGFVLDDGTRLNIRPIRPEDEPQLVRFHSTLSEQSVYRRYFALINLESRIRHDRLTRMCFIDYDRQMAFVAEHPNDDSSPGEIIGVGRLIKSPSQKEAEVAAVVSDLYHRKGIGRALVNRLVAFAKDEKLRVLTASVLADNPAMQKLLEGVGFTFHESSAPEILDGELRLIG